MTVIRFYEGDRVSGRELGTARLVDGHLVASTAALQHMIDLRAMVLDMNGVQIAEYYSAWSNGYVSSERVADPAVPCPAERPATTVGIDLAAAPDGTAIVAIDWGTSTARARLVCDAADGSADTAAILEALQEGDKVGIDCPFGWPAEFVDAVVAHRDREPWPTGPDLPDRRALRLRATDRHVAGRGGPAPLAVSSDRIGSVAMRWAALLSRHEQKNGPIDRAGSGRLVEVYPALAIRHWRMPSSGYKNNDDAGRAACRAVMREVVDQRPGLALDADLLAAADHPRRGDDVVDALIAALIAAAAATPDGVEALPDPDTAQGRGAATEGWIAIPQVSLSELAPRRR